jgi:hypothetical protein
MRTSGTIVIVLTMLGAPALAALAPAQTPPPGTQTSPASPGQAGTPARASGPDPELRGLAALGIVVEELSSQAAACGLNQAAIEAAAAKSLSDAGFKVLRNADEDTYVYVQVMTTSASSGLCVSRYDVFLYTFANATLSYQVAPLLVQVSLLHKGGLTGGAPATHGEAVTRNVKQYVDEFASRIRTASR